MEQKREIKELKEFKKVNDELIVSLEENGKDMQDEITKFEYQIYELGRIIQEKDEQLVDSERATE